MALKKNAQISGAIVREHVALLRDKYGSERVDRALSPLDRDAREELDALIAVQWVRVSTMETFYRQIAKELGRDMAELHWEIGTESVERTFRTIWRLLLSVTTDQALVARTPVIYAKTYTVGKMSSKVIAPGTAEIVLTDWPDVPTFVRRALCIGISTVLSLAGRQNVEIRDEWRRDGAMFVATWTP